LRRPASSLDDERFVEPAPEKLAAELLWLGHKMAEFAWARIGSRALVAEPTIQVSLIWLAGT
jgi:hypothetical protein